MQPETSIIIRTRNEERWIGETLSRLQAQTYRDFEIIVIDSGSTDRTLEIVREFPISLVQIKPEEFTFPYAINVGITHSQATRFYAILSAHSLPIGKIWLESAVSVLKNHPHAMGVYGPLKAMPDGTFTDKLFHNSTYYFNRSITLGGTTRVITKGKAGVLGFTNAMIRKDLYDQYPINESFAAGGEDGDWANHWFAEGYYAIKDSRFAVHHSHYLGPIGWWNQLQHWFSVAKPQPYERLTYRKDGAHAPIPTER